jgi:type I restriction enzyme S subunit
MTEKRTFKRGAGSPSTILDSYSFPEEWSIRQLGDVADIDVGFPFPSSAFTDTMDAAGHPLVRIRDLPNALTQTYLRGPVDHEVADRYRIARGDILIGMDGYFHIVRWPHDDHLLNQRVARIRNIRSNADDEFLRYAIVKPIKQIEREKHFTTVKHLSMGDLRHLPVPFPPLPEQRAIAHVLRTVQQAKEATEKVITATKELKRSLMRHLFTYGPVPVDQADQVELKESEVGEIPTHWSIKQIEQIGTVKGGKRLPKGHSFAECTTPYPYIRVVDFHANGVRLDDLRYLEPSDHAAISRYIIRKADVYISIAGTIGVVGVIPDMLDGANLTENAARIVIDCGDVDQWFLTHFLHSDRGQLQITMRTTKTSQPKLALSRIKQLRIPIPPLHEQEEIARQLRAVQSKIETERVRESALAQVFDSLLQSLMTGKSRVAPD